MLYHPAKSPHDLPSILCPIRLPKRDAVRAHTNAFKKNRTPDSQVEVTQAAVELHDDLCPAHLPMRFAVLAQIKNLKRLKAD